MILVGKPHITSKSQLPYNSKRRASVRHRHSPIIPSLLTKRQSDSHLSNKLFSFASGLANEKLKKKKQVVRAPVTPPRIIPKETKRDISSYKPLNRIKAEDVMLTIHTISRSSFRKKMTFDDKTREFGSPHYSEMIDIQDKAKPYMSFLPQMSTTFNDFESKRDSLFKTKEKINVHMSELQNNRITFREANILRYRENVFRAASRLTKEIFYLDNTNDFQKEMPPYPKWAYRDEDLDYLDITKINVGGQIFSLFKETLSKLICTKLGSCLSEHSSKGIPFFDRDYNCFNAILNFYRTGRLHVPPNTCLTLFEEELEFWGVSEQFMEPCCWNEFRSFKTASNTLKKHAEDLDKGRDFNDFNQTIFLNLRIKLYKIMTTGTGNIYARWVSFLVAAFILLSIFAMIIGSTPYGRVNIDDLVQVDVAVNETVSHYLGRTKIITSLERLEILISGFFLAELIFRVILCPNRLELFSDTLNWVDLLATTTTLMSNIFSKDHSTGNYEGYMLLLKLPRIFRLLKLTANLRSGMDAFTLTIRASANELRLIFLLLFIMTAVFGSLIFVVEMVNESSVATEKSAFKNIYLGMWWAFVTMAAVGFGDFVPLTTLGFLLGSVTMMFGVIICQLPVPIVLKNFSIYHNQASARLNRKTCPAHTVDPESISDDEDQNRLMMKKKGLQKFHKMFGKLM